MQRQGIDAQEAAGIVGRVTSTETVPLYLGGTQQSGGVSTETVRAYSIAGYVPR